MNIVVFGATAEMIQETLRQLVKDSAPERAKLVLVARNTAKADAVAGDLVVRGAANAIVVTADLADTGGIADVWHKAKARFDKVDLVLVAHGTLPDQKACEQSFSQTERALHENFLSVVALLTPVANDLEAQGSGTIAVVTSVAGDRGRQSNYVYGAAKGAVTLFLQGLRNRLAKKGVAVVDIKPGFVSTPMTAHIKQGPLFVDAAVAGRAIARAIQKRRDIVYVPFFWRFIMLIIRSIPERLFKGLKL